MRKFIIVLLVSLLLLQPGSGWAAEPPQVTARAAVVLDQATGRILFSKNAHEQLPMASTTKIMTAILAVESGKLAEVVTVSEYASLVEGSSVDLEAGEKKTLEELLFGLILRSGNDAAAAIAEFLAGSVEEFAEQMTEKAHALGAVHTNFMNPHGLDHEEHYTTAYDLGLIAVHAMTLPKFREVAATAEKKISWTGRSYDRLLSNQNKLLTMYEGAEGIKTGWTTPAGRCFVGAAARDDWRLVTVVLNAPEMWEDTTDLLDFGYAHYQRKTIVKAETPLKTAAVRKGAAQKISLVASEDIMLPLKDNEADLLRYAWEVPEEVQAPISKGEQLGTLRIYFGTQQVSEVPLVAAAEVESKGLFASLRKFFQRIF
ncbi:MAG TPA: D-alanyl-D-alanine carboxypeptidase family protein [Oscillospiraceae bacterium]|nr:D-alanyl-D-alanine carboxypeptidase family protein [Oscillospiraceae bacterium]